MFDIEKLKNAEINARTAVVEAKELACFFGDDKPEFVVRNLTGEDIARVNSDVAENKSDIIRETIRALQAGGTKEAIEGFKEFLLDAEDRLPDDLIRQTGTVSRGIVSPELDREALMKIRDNFPGVFVRLYQKIQMLSAQGGEIVGEHGGSGASPA